MNNFSKSDNEGDGIEETNITIREIWTVLVRW